MTESALGQEPILWNENVSTSFAGFERCNLVKRWLWSFCHELIDVERELGVKVVSLHELYTSICFVYFILLIELIYELSAFPLESFYWIFGFSRILQMEMHHSLCECWQKVSIFGLAFLRTIVTSVNWTANIWRSLSVVHGLAEYRSSTRRHSHCFP